MKPDQLIRANQISEKLEVLNKELDRWKNATRFSGRIELLNGKANRYEDAKSDFVQFDVVKALTVSVIEKQINELNEEFSRL